MALEGGAARTSRHHPLGKGIYTYTEPDDAGNPVSPFASLIAVSISTLAMFARQATKERQVFTREQLKESYLRFSQENPALRHPRFDRVLAALLLNENLTEIEIQPENKRSQGRPPYKPFLRYGWDGTTVMDVAASLRPGSYFSHGTAATLHGLLPSDAIYVNKEQSAKPSTTGNLTQEAIDRAFSSAPRVSQYVYVFEGKRIVLLSGKNTADFEVIDRESHMQIPMRYTSLERTLFDIAVRPAYAGGVSNVLKAFYEARERIVVPTIIKVMKRISHVYPYHQAVGFYLHRAGFSKVDLTGFKQLGLKFNFYLANKMKKPKLDADWKVFVPADLSN